MREPALSESLEDYLETILALQLENTVARSKDIALKLDIKRGSVTGMLKKLAGKALINYEPYGFVTLTPEGEKIAEEITARHTLFKEFLVTHLRLDENLANETACRMEHAMSHTTFLKFKTFIKNLDC